MQDEEEKMNIKVKPTIDLIITPQQIYLKIVSESLLLKFTQHWSMGIHYTSLSLE